MLRIDLSEWIIHFIHSRNPENIYGGFIEDPESGETHAFPDDFTFDGTAIYKSDEYEEEYYGLEPDAGGYGVLKKILTCGYLQSGYSFRGTNATIYGPKAAICFTEMPLYALIQYAKTRASENYTDDYGIAFLRNELFMAGARPVIYGLSSTHKEANENDPNVGKGYRQLASSVGIGLREQYRYVATNLRPEKRIDWTHEREWRWADSHERFEQPGMPFLQEVMEPKFTKMIVIVKDDEEADEILELLRNLYDSKTDPFGREYDLSAIQQTSVVSIDSLKRIDKDLATIRLDDIPLKHFKAFKKIVVSPATLQLVKEVWAEVETMEYDETKKFIDEYGEPGSAGFCNLVTYDAQTEITQALVQLGIAEGYTNYYILSGLKGYPTQSLDAIEAGVKKVAEHLTKRLGQRISTTWRLD